MKKVYIIVFKPIHQLFNVKITSMCHVICGSKKELSKEERREQTVEINKKHNNAVIMFISKDQKNWKKVLEKYLKRHKKAIRLGVKLV